MSHSRKSPASILLLAIFVCMLSLPVHAQKPNEKEGNNPIGDFFRGLNKNVREGAKEIELANQGHDQIDSRVPQNQDFTRRLLQAIEFLEQQRWHDAVSILQFLLESDTDYFFFDKEKNLISVQAEVTRMLATLPEEAQRNYLNRFEAIAIQQYDSAVRSQNGSELADVAKSYPQTVAGRSAAYQSILTLRDQGELASASRMFAQLARTETSPILTQKYAILATQCALDCSDQTAVEKLATEFSLTESDYRSPIRTAQNSNLLTARDSSQILSSASNIDGEIQPHFLPVWIQPTIDRHIVEEQIGQLYSDLREVGRSVIPTEQAIIADEFIAYRSLRGLEVRNLSNGELLWENRSTSNIESRFTNSAREPELDLRYRGRVPEHNPITSLLLRDGISKSLTTDGRHLFAIEAHEYITDSQRSFAWQRRGNLQIENHEQWTTNEIVAYEIATGRVRWRVGGKTLEEPFSRPLAGTFFFGPPVSYGEDLYVIGEFDGAISLYSLDPHTGEVVWSQEIAIASSGVNDDQVRRFWPCYPTVKDGIIVCPTTCGWLVAVDATTHQLLWSTRFSERKTRQRRYRSGNTAQSLQDLNRRWLPSPPVIYENYVVVTPPELPNEFGTGDTALFCFDLSTGDQLWKQPKNECLYLAGIHHGNAILVAEDYVIARKIKDDGRVAWKANIEDVDGRPSGRGAIVNQQLLIPFNGKTLIQIDLESGDVAAAIHHDSAQFELGHLYIHADRLHSLSTFNIASFPIHSLSNAERIALTNSVISELIAIESLMANEQYTAAIDAIQNVGTSPMSQQLTASDREHLQQLEWEAMEQIVIKNETRADEMLLTMQTLAASPSELARYRRLAADRTLTSGDPVTALQHYLSLLEQSRPNQFFDEETRQVRVDVWVGGRILDLIENADVQTQEIISQTISSQLDQLQQRVEPNRLARAIFAVPAGQQLEFSLAEQAIADDKFAEALVRLQRLTMVKDQSIAQSAWSTMAKVLTQMKAYSDAAQCWNQLLVLLESSTDEDSASMRESARAELKRLREFKVEWPPQTSWGNRWEAVRTGSQGAEQNLSEIIPVGTPFEFLDSYRYLYQSQHERLRIENKQNGQPIWSLPLRSMTNSTQRASVGLRLTGPICYAVNRGAVHAILFPERRVAWTYTPHVSGLAASRLRSPSRRRSSQLSPLRAFQERNNLTSYSTPTGLLLAANEHGVLVIDRELHALDPLTGERLWTETEIAPRALANCFSDKFLLIKNDSGKIHRLLDGKAVSAVSPDSINQCLELSASHNCLKLIPPSEEDAKWTLQRSQFRGPESTWTLPIHEQSQLEKLDEQSYVLLEPHGELFLVDTESGKKTALGTLSGDLVKNSKRIYTFCDQDNVYVVVAHGNGRTSYINLSSIPALGTILAYSKSGGLLWSQSTHDIAKSLIPDTNAKTEDGDKQKPKDELWQVHLVVRQIEHLPVLLLIHERTESRGQNHFRRLTMIGLDKQTGKRTLDWNRISSSGSFSYLHVNLRERYIDLRTYNERLNLRPVLDVAQADLEDGE